MIYPHTVKGVFIDRPNRFIAHVTVDGTVETVHVKNTGRCKELLLPGVTVALSVSDNPNRKTKYDLISVYKQNVGWINIDSQVPNTVVREWLDASPAMLPPITNIRPEFTFGDSRVDFYLESGEKKILLEVKGCTLERDGTGFFPDAPTERGVKHLHELTQAVKLGYSCYIAFVIAIPGVCTVFPNIETHPAFGRALDEAFEAGVDILYLTCDVRYDSLTVIGARIKER